MHKADTQEIDVCVYILDKLQNKRFSAIAIGNSQAYAVNNVRKKPWQQ